MVLAFTSTGLVSKRRRADIRLGPDSDGDSSGTQEANTSHVPNSVARATSQALPLRDVFEAAQVNTSNRGQTMPDTPMKPTASLEARVGMHRRGVSMGSTLPIRSPLFTAPQAGSPIHITRTAAPTRTRPEPLQISSFTHDIPRRHVRSVSERSAVDMGLPISSTPLPSSALPQLLPLSPSSPESPLVSFFRGQRKEGAVRKTFYPTATTAQADRIKSGRSADLMDSPGNCFASPSKNPPITLTVTDNSDEQSPIPAPPPLSFQSQPMPGGPMQTPHGEAEHSADIVFHRSESQFERIFTVEGVLGRGEFSHVMRVRNKETGQVSAVKRMNQPFVGPKDRLRRLEEVDVLRLLKSQRDLQRDPFFGSAAIIDFLAAWEEDRHLYIQTELCPLGTLASVLAEYGRQVGPLDEARLWKMLAELSSALDFIHKCNVLHLDLKPDNVLITEIGSLKISDFGMATRWPRASAHEILDGAGLDIKDLVPMRRDSEGSDISMSPPIHSPTLPEVQNERRRGARSRRVTPALEREGDREYLAPEVMYESKYGRPADMFSLGLILLEAACSVEIPDNGEPWHKLRNDDFSDVDMNLLSAAMQNVITTLLCSKPELRLSAAELVDMPALGVVRAHMHRGLRASELDQLPAFSTRESDTRYPLPASKYYEPPMPGDDQDRRVVRFRGALIQEDEPSFLADVLAAAGSNSTHASSPDTSMSLLTDENPPPATDVTQSPLVLWYGDRPDAPTFIAEGKHSMEMDRGTVSMNEQDDEEMFWSSVQVQVEQDADAEQTGSSPLGGFFYVPEFITAAEEERLIERVNMSGKGTLIAEPLPDWVTRSPDLISRIRETGAFQNSAHGEPNHCLVNEYLPGQGIMPHNDGPAYFPAVATVSLGSSILYDVYELGESGYPTEPTFSVLLEPRSLLVSVGWAYTDYIHGIAEEHQTSVERLAQATNARGICEPLERSTRISLTFRDVERVRRIFIG
ncbi:non-specific serine/threonine protein kinase [Malassezia cuniculi]|uniref:Non-specific serine/threonine protein kinase n=1 Tax=Malassezia cuniculi TaxID=948313 RepID=A0AAF0ERL1_9BASI|nr:non-specific serine/threonine protein kinase [Malassezia cuniculi]